MEHGIVLAVAGGAWSLALLALYIDPIIHIYRERRRSR